MSHEFLSIRAFRVQKQINGFLMNQFMNINYLSRTLSERLPNSASTLLRTKILFILFDNSLARENIFEF